jgi:Gpi18-like mannosyltransferase
MKVSRNTQLAIFAAIVITLSLVIKWQLVKFTSYDIGILTYWYDYLHSHGFQGFRDNFANYNAPYLYLLWLLTHLPIDKIIAIKLLSISFDFVLAFAVYYFVKTIKPKGDSAVYAGLFTLCLPTVIANGALWGQCDGLYTAFVIFAFAFALKRKSWLSWVFWGIAISFKLQAIFALPALLYLWLLHRKTDAQQALSPVAAVGVFIAGVLPTLLAGKPLSDIVTMYQGLTSQTSLNLNAASLYAWVPNNMYNYFNKAGVALTLLVVISVLWFCYQTIYRGHSRLGVKEALLLPLCLFVAIPFFLPQMHERYFFTAEIFAFVVAFVLGGRWIIVAVALQATALMAYAPYLFNVSSSIVAFAALLQLFVLGYITYQLFDHRVVFKQSLTIPK